MELNMFLVPAIGIEPICLHQATDFESVVSTNFTTPATQGYL